MDATDGSDEVRGLPCCVVLERQSLSGVFSLGKGREGKGKGVHISCVERRVRGKKGVSCEGAMCIAHPIEQVEWDMTLRRRRVVLLVLRVAPDWRASKVMMVQVGSG